LELALPFGGDDCGNTEKLVPFSELGGTAVEHEWDLLVKVAKLQQVEADAISGPAGRRMSARRPKWRLIRPPPGPSGG
jgi:hypothetical protein